MATTITANGINFPDGSAGSPSIGGSDTNTGLFTGSDIVGFATGGSERLKIDASGNVNIANDSGKLQLGASNDLQIYHDGTNSYISEVGTGVLRITADSGVHIRKHNNENIAQFTANGNVELYYDNSLKFETLTDGTKVTGTLRFDTSDTAITIADSKKIKFGNSDDLQIYHDGSDSYVANTTGALYILPKSGENGIQLVPDGTVRLYYDNSAKFETTSTGVTVTGGIHALGYGAIEGSPNTYKYGRGSQGGGLSIYGAESAIEIVSTEDGTHGGSVLLRTATDGAGFVYNPTDNALELKTFTPSGDSFSIHGTGVNVSSLDTQLRVVKDAQVELYHNNSKKFETTTEGFKTQGTGQATVLIGSTDGSGAYLLLDGDSNGDGDGGDYSYVGMTTQGVLRLHNLKNEDLEFATNAQTRARFTSSGHFVPQANNTYDLGSTGARWANVYTNDLNLSNEGSSNDVDGTWGDWTIQEGESDLFLKNNRSGKKYKFNLTEVS